MTHYEGYCTNVHPGETLAEVSQVLRQDVVAVKARVAPQRPFGMGLRLGNTVTRALEDPDARAGFVDLLRQNDLYVFTVNGFPYGDFAARSVKEAVYEPDWRDPARLDYTLALAELVAALPGPKFRTISTVAGGFRPDTQDAHGEMGAQLRAAADGLAALFERTGVHIRLCLEPEPWTTLETTPEAIAFFDAHLSTPNARRYLGLCYDCCHQAVLFEDAATSVKALAAADITIGKVQVSSALTLPDPQDAEARLALLRFSEPRYLHQVVGRTPDGLVRAKDLPLLRGASEWMRADSWRCHFHVPIWWDGDAHLGTTKADWQAAVTTALAADPNLHLEIETYTFHVLPRQLAADVTESVAREFAALREVVGVGR